MAKLIRLIVAASVLAWSAAWAQPSARTYDIDVRFDPAAATLEAEALVGVDGAADVLDFYLHDELRVSAVTIGGRPAPFSQSLSPYEYEYSLQANHVQVSVRGQDLSGGVRIAYAGRFTPSTARAASDYMRASADGVFLRAYGYSMWFPTFVESGADPGRADFTRVRITAPTDFRSVFVGEHLNRSESAGTAVETWRAPDLNLFDAQLSLRRYAVTNRGPIFAYSLDDEPSRAAAERIVSISDALLGYYRDHYRATAASDPIRIIQLPRFGNIASANVIGVDDETWRSLTAENDEVTTLAHELVHAFVQGRTPRTDPLYAFSIEGFPSYFHWPALGAVSGAARYEARMDRVQAQYLERRRSGVDRRGNPLPPEKPILQITADEIGIYKDTFILNDRALLFWDHLRRSLPPQAFDALVADMTARDSLTSEDFFALLQARAPDFVEDAHLWLESSEFPERLQRPLH